MNQNPSKLFPSFFFNKNRSASTTESPLPDVVAGIMSACVALPLSLAVAVASGAPPAAGLLAAIVAGLVMSRFTGAHLVVGGPAAGLAPAVFLAIYSLGQGNMAVGYPLVLPIIVAVGLAQTLLGKCRYVEGLNRLIPPMVIKGVLVSVGILVMLKQIPTLLGYTTQAQGTFASFAEIFTMLPSASPAIAGLGVGTLILVALFSTLKDYVGALKIFPPFFYAMVVAMIVSVLLPLDFGRLLELPANPLSAVVLPNLSGLLQNSEIWGGALQSFLAILVIGTVESTASWKAIDQLDVQNRQTVLGPSLRGLGMANAASGFVGGLSVIPEVMRSTVAVAAGARSPMVNLWYALALLIGWLALLPVLELIPMTILAAVLLVCAYGLARPQFWKQAWASGGKGASVFLTTIGVTLLHDLMLGLIAGSLLHLLYLSWEKRWDILHWFVAE